MSIYKVMLEGRYNHNGFYITITVAAPDETQAEVMAEVEAEQRGLNIFCTEAITDTKTSFPHNYAIVLNVSGKSFFPLDDEPTDSNTIDSTRRERR